jgi:Flp pilus assembly protein TadB
VGKGRPTPKRSEAQKARRQRAKAPANRREALRQERERVRADRARQREALRTGDPRHLPRRDQGPVRAAARDLVDSRRSLGEYFIVVALGFLLLSLLPIPVVRLAVGYVWILMLLLIVADSVRISRRLKRELAERFPDEDRRGAVMYGVLRSTQLRRLRLPAPRVGPGATV